MKKLFIEAFYDGKIDLSKIKPKLLPKRVGLATTVQYAPHLRKLKEFLTKEGKEVVVSRGAQKYPGQVLGCEQSASLDAARKADCIIFMGDGLFHPIGIQDKTSKDVFIVSPRTGEFKKLGKKDIEGIKLKKKARALKFLSAKKVGVIVSTKPGQNRLKQAKKMLKRYKDKDFYYLLFDSVDYNQLENFNFIDCWVNTACPRIEEDLKLVNLGELEKLT